MPRPTNEARVRRIIEVLELDDSVRAGEPIPGIREIAERLRMNTNDASVIRRHIAERHGRTVPIRVRTIAPKPDPWRSRFTRLETDALRALAQADMPITATELYARATNTPPEFASDHGGRRLICALRKKGVRISNEYGSGYWLEEAPMELAS